MKKDWILIIIIILSYSLTAFAYINATFAGKDIISRIDKRLDRIENKIDDLRN